MNQFKKAKLQRMEAGQEVESVSGLQKTGIQESNKEEAKSTDINIEIEGTNNTIAKEEVQETPESYTKDIIEEHIDSITPPEISSTKKESEEETKIEEIVLEEKSEKESIPEETFIPVITPVVKIEQPEIRNTPEPIMYERVKVVEVEKQEIPKTTKKVPNIFNQKEESKSVRKSLVLKPSSVKKAETYCVRNGGSFNELVQHLLDEFISEYGL